MGYLEQESAIVSNMKDDNPKEELEKLEESMLIQKSANEKQEKDHDNVILDHIKKLLKEGNQSEDENLKITQKIDDSKQISDPIDNHLKENMLGEHVYNYMKNSKEYQDLLKQSKQINAKITQNNEDSKQISDPIDNHIDDKTIGDNVFNYMKNSKEYQDLLKQSKVEHNKISQNTDDSKQISDPTNNHLSNKTLSEYVDNYMKNPKKYLDVLKLSKTENEKINHKNDDNKQDLINNHLNDKSLSEHMDNHLKLSKETENYAPLMNDGLLKDISQIAPSFTSRHSSPDSTTTSESQDTTVEQQLHELELEKEMLKEKERHLKLMSELKGKEQSKYQSKENMKDDSEKESTGQSTNHILSTSENGKNDKDTDISTDNIPKKYNNSTQDSEKTDEHIDHMLPNKNEANSTNLLDSTKENDKSETRIDHVFHMIPGKSESNSTSENDKSEGHIDHMLPSTAESNSTKSEIEIEKNDDQKGSSGSTKQMDQKEEQEKNENDKNTLKLQHMLHLTNAKQNSSLLEDSVTEPNVLNRHTKGILRDITLKYAKEKMATLNGIEHKKHSEEESSGGDSSVHQKFSPQETVSISPSNSKSHTAGSKAGTQEENYNVAIETKSIPSQIENSKDRKKKNRRDEKLGLPINNPTPNDDDNIEPHANFHHNFHSKLLENERSQRIISPIHSPLSKSTKESVRYIHHHRRAPSMMDGLLPPAGMGRPKIEILHHHVSAILEPPLVSYHTDSNHHAIITESIPGFRGAVNTLANLLKHKVIPSGLSEKSTFIKPKSFKLVDVTASKKGFGRPPSKPRSYLLNELRNRIKMLAIKRHFARKNNAIKHQNRQKLFLSNISSRDTKYSHPLNSIEPKVEAGNILVPASTSNKIITLTHGHGRDDQSNVIIPGSSYARILPVGKGSDPGDITRSQFPKINEERHPSIEDVFNIIGSEDQINARNEIGSTNRRNRVLKTNDGNDLKNLISKINHDAPSELEQTESLVL